MFKPILAAILILTPIAQAQTTRPAVELPTRVSMKIDNELIDDALQDFCKAAKVSLRMRDQNPSNGGLQIGGIPIRMPGMNSGPTGSQISIKADNEPLIKVFYNLLQQTQFIPVGADQNSPATAMASQKTVRTELIKDQMLLMIHNVSCNGGVDIESKSTSFNYSFSANMVFDPGMKVFDVADNARVTQLVSGDATLIEQGYSSNDMNLQQVDGRMIGVHAFTFNLQTNKRLKEITSLSMEIKAYVALEEKEAKLNKEDISKGTSQGKDGLVIMVGPNDPNDTNTIRFTASGPVWSELMNRHPWSQCLPSFIQVEGSNGPLTDIFLTEINRSGDSTTFRIYRNGSTLKLEEIESISIHLPTKAKAMMIPLTLSDLPIP